MSKMKGMLGMAMMMASLGSMASSGSISDKINSSFNPESDEERKRRLDNAEIERKKKQGLKQFFYGENSVWALNQKSADKKARKNNWI